MSEKKVTSISFDLDVLKAADHYIAERTEPEIADRSALVNKALRHYLNIMVNLEPARNS